MYQMAFVGSLALPVVRIFSEPATFFSGTLHTRTEGTWPRQLRRMRVSGERSAFARK